jgi:hypothetical protein
MKKILELFCSQCDTHVLTYQKDGAGNLLKLYLDRVLEYNPLLVIDSYQQKSDMPALECPQCGQVIGVPMLDEKAHRLAYRVMRGALRKQKQQ